jgi:hypothetical protein
MLLVNLCWLKINYVHICDYPVVSYVVQNVDVNTPLVLYSWSK